MICIRQEPGQREVQKSDNLFLLYACIDHYKYKGKPLYITAYDYEQAFDSLWLQDCIMSMMRLGIPVDILHLVYLLNKKAAIVVKTPFGMTEASYIEDIVEQGTVLGPNLCSVTTAEYCGINKGIAVGDAVVSSLLFVDDDLDVNGTTEDAVCSHENAILFARMKKIGHSKKKCKTMVMNGKKTDIPPDLYIEESKVDSAAVIAYLGDLINNKGTNADLITDRHQRGVTAMIKIEALVRETGLGIHTVNVHLLLYQSLFLSCVLFNSQVWRNLSEKEINKLESLQRRCLRKIFNAPHSTSRSFVYLEFGAVPIRYIIQQNQLMFLHHIVHLKDDDPVKQMWENMKFLSRESNWWSSIRRILEEYEVGLEEVKNSSRESFKALIKRKISDTALKELTKDCTEKTKTSSLHYTALKPQDYLSHLYPKQARIIFQCRSKTLDIKVHRSYKFNDRVCRKCGIDEETIQHITNCGRDEVVDTSFMTELGDITYPTKVNLSIVAERISTFLEEVR